MSEELDVTAALAYEAYRTAHAGTVAGGLPMPMWEQLSVPERDAWLAVAGAVRGASGPARHPVLWTQEDLEHLTVSDLREMAQVQHLTVPTSATKQQLIDALLAHQGAPDEGALTVFTLRVHRYEINPQTAERELVEYKPLLRLGCSSPDGYSGEIVYLQGGCVYGEGGAQYLPEDLPDWVAGAMAAVHPQALADVGFTPDVVQAYCTNGQDEQEDEAPTPAMDPPYGGAYPPGFKPDHWILGWLCKRGHDYARTGHSRYDKSMRCVDCHNEDRAASARKRKEAAREQASG